jgi:aryl-alcohol dehydrogenase-like predicted oxidoreductase
MDYRTLGKTGLEVAEVGMGTWQLAGKPWGWDAPDENESMKALYRYVELGGNFWTQRGSMVGLMNRVMRKEAIVLKN